MRPPVRGCVREEGEGVGLTESPLKLIFHYFSMSSRGSRVASPVPGTCSVEGMVRGTISLSSRRAWANPRAARPSTPQPNVHVLELSAQMKAVMTIIRDAETSREDFKFFADRIVRHVVEAGLAYTPYEEKTIATPTGVSAARAPRAAAAAAAAAAMRCAGCAHVPPRGGRRRTRGWGLARSSVASASSVRASRWRLR